MVAQCSWQHKGNHAALYIDRPPVYFLSSSISLCSHSSLSPFVPFLSIYPYPISFFHLPFPVLLLLTKTSLPFPLPLLLHSFLEMMTLLALTTMCVSSHLLALPDTAGKENGRKRRKNSPASSPPPAKRRRRRV